MVNSGRTCGKSCLSIATTKVFPKAIWLDSLTRYFSPSAILISNGMPSLMATSMRSLVILASIYRVRRSSQIEAFISGATESAGQIVQRTASPSPRPGGEGRDEGFRLTSKGVFKMKSSLTFNRTRSLHFHSKTGGADNFRQVAAIEPTAIAFRFEQMLFEIFFVALNHEFQFVHFIGPAEAGEELRAGKLRFVERVLRIAGAQIQILQPALGEEIHRAGHHE